MENHHFSWENPQEMVIFHSYVSLLEGKVSNDLSGLSVVWFWGWRLAETVSNMASLELPTEKWSYHTERKPSTLQSGWWWTCFMTFHEQLGMEKSSQLTFTPSFFRGVGWNHQPVSILTIIKHHHTIIITINISHIWIVSYCTKQG